MPVDTTAVKQMLDDELVSDGNRQIKAAGLRAALKALVDWVGSVAGVPGPQGPAGNSCKVKQVTSSGVISVENNFTYIIEKHNNTIPYNVSLVFDASLIPVSTGIAFTIIVGTYATVNLSQANFPILNDAMFPNGLVRLGTIQTPTSIYGSDIRFNETASPNTYTFPKGVYQCAFLNGTLWVW